MTSTGFEVLKSPVERRAIGYRWVDGAWVEEPTMADGAFNSMGGLQTSANDYARYVAWLLSAWPAQDGPETGPLNRARIRELARSEEHTSELQSPMRKSYPVFCFNKKTSHITHYS